MSTPENRPIQQEKRKYPRLKKDVSISFKLANSPNIYSDTFSQNISMGGMMIELMHADEPLKKGNILEMELQGPPASSPVKVIGRIIWIKDSKFSMKLQVGIQILAILEGDEAGFQRLLK